MKRIRIGVLSVASSVLAFGGLSMALSPSVFAQPLPITEYPAPATSLGIRGGLAKGSDGNIWFIENNTNKIGKMTSSGAVTEYNIGLTANADLRAIAAGPNNTLWFTELNANKIGSITTSGTITEYSTGLTAGAGPLDITAGPDGNMWFTETGQNKIGKIIALSANGTIGTITEYAAGGQLDMLTTGGDGNIWYTLPNGNAVSKMNTSGTVLNSYPMTTSSSTPLGIGTGPNGDVWVAERDGNKLADVAPNGTMTEHTLPTTNAEPLGITAGPDGYMWFTEWNSSKVGYITPSGSITEMSTTTPTAQPVNIVAGADGNIWFVELSSANNVAKVTLPPKPTATAQTISATAGKAVTVNVLSGATNNPDPSTVTIDSSPAHGTATIDHTTGAITYTPAAGFTGTDSLSFIVCSLNDGGICSADPVLTFNVTATGVTPDTGYGELPTKQVEVATLVSASLLLIGAGIVLRRKFSRS